MALTESLIQKMAAEGRHIVTAKAGDDALGPLSTLPGIWKNTPALHGFGFNMIALPFAGSKFGYRLLMNQYDEELHFSIVDKGVPNRGVTVDPATKALVTADQTIVAMDYDQKIVQIAAEDFPKSDQTQKFQGQAIHKEPGLWLYMTDQTTDGINIARLGAVPHGNSLLALGTAGLEPVEGLPDTPVPTVNGVAVGMGIDPAVPDFASPYMAPYKHFHDTPFKGNVPIAGFAGFEPVDTTALLRHALATALPGKVKKTMQLHVDSTLDRAGIHNIPFVVRQADAAAINATFNIYEVEDAETGQTRYFLQYVQNVILDFINRIDGHPGKFRWPHVSINTMERVGNADPDAVKARMVEM